MITRLASLWKKLIVLATPRTVHLAALAASAAFQFLAATFQWFFYDDWSFIVGTSDKLWEPHVGHWSTGPYLVFAAIKGVVGIRSYVPFAIPVIVAHLALVHITWRVMIRGGALPWVASGLSVILAFFGAGGENIVWAFQVGFIGAMALALVVVLLVDRVRLSPAAIVGIVACSLAAVMFSGTSIPVLIAAGLVSWARRGALRTIALLGPSAALFGAWYALVGSQHEPALAPAQGIGQLFGMVPDFAFRMLTDGLATVSPIPTVGVLAVAALFVWAVLNVRGLPSAQVAAYALAVAAVIFGLLTGYSRLALGLETATSSRYVYFVSFCIFPLAALALSALVRWRESASRVAAVAIAVLIVYNVSQLGVWMNYRADIDDLTRDHLSAAASLVSESPGLYPSSARIYPVWTPQIKVSGIEQLIDLGLPTDAPYSAEAKLSVLALISVELDQDATNSTSGACVDVRRGAQETALPWPEFTVSSLTGSTFDFTLSDGNVNGSARTAAFDSPSMTLRQMSELSVVVLDAESDLTVCPLT